MRRTLIAASVISCLVSLYVVHSKARLAVRAETLNEAYILATATPLATATSAATAGPTKAPKKCGNYCWNNADCGGILNCYYGYCRNPNCLTETDCDCSAATPTPTTTPTPTAAPLVIPPEILILLPSEEIIIYGYAPTNSLVKLMGIGVNETTQARDDGFFIFKSLSFPTTNSYLVGNLYPELCLQAVDSVKRTTQPVCIPPLSLKSVTRKVGPVILPPTISIEKGSFVQGEQTKASGITTPNTEVEVYLAREKIPGFIEIIKEAFAYYIPTYQTTSNGSGYFEFNLPSDSPENWKIFTASKILGASSPKSNTLSFNILPSYSKLIRFLIYLLGLIKAYLIYIVILLQILLIAILVEKLRRKKKANNHSKQPKNKSKKSI